MILDTVDAVCPGYEQDMGIWVKCVRAYQAVLCLILQHPPLGEMVCTTAANMMKEKALSPDSCSTKLASVFG